MSGSSTVAVVFVVAEEGELDRFGEVDAEELETESSLSSEAELAFEPASKLPLEVRLVAVDGELAGDADVFAANVAEGLVLLALAVCGAATEAGPLSVWSTAGGVA
jgi:hypothetical protein